MGAYSTVTASQMQGGTKAYPIHVSPHGLSPLSTQTWILRDKIPDFTSRVLLSWFSTKAPDPIRTSQLSPIGKNALTVFNGQMNSKSKRVSALKVSISTAATSLKKKNNIQTNTIPKNVAFIVSNECNLEKTPSDERSDASIGTQDANLGTKRVRRQSFTSSFMERLEEKLPNIDDDRNPLEVSA
ncbi:hypothetical protein Sjap_018068 [Stephania japonica]|uniref:Uncharacterized protein n=1 Tax=Stephania japonica TaxID=461633 RepID=A0AAP0I7A9_9MAGN